jgi:hypothetical protein
MKYIAVIGCSFTAHSCPGDENVDEWNSWSQYIPQDFPNVEVHNYGYSAMSNNYFEILLKNLAHFKHYKYDAVILQLSSTWRWSLPIDTPVESYMRYNQFWQDRDPEFKADGGHSLDPLIIEHDIPTNINRYKHMIDLSSLITFGGNNEHITGIRHSQPLDRKKLRYINSLVNGGLPLTEIYLESFIKTISMYEKYFSKVFYWSAFDHANNIGKELGSFDELKKHTNTDYSKYTRVDKGDPGHLNREGNKLLYQIYIKNSAIGNWLGEIN